MSVILDELEEQVEESPEAVRRAVERGGIRSSVNKGDAINIRNGKTPASASASGKKGDITWDSSFIYVCVDKDTWERVAIASW